MKELPLEDRPYEKLERYGASKLTDSELLAIIIKSGTKNISSVKLAQNLLTKESTSNTGFSIIKDLSIKELETFNGIGKVKAIQIKALFEIARRIKYQESKKSSKIKSPETVYALVRAEMEDLNQEVIKTVILNVKNDVISIITNAMGGQSKIIITPKEILSEPLKQMASSIILVHNHPSGDPTPSKEDVNFTRSIMSAASLFDIDVLDHIVVGKNCFKSLKEMNLI
ncbi:MAG: DNA repair protein RadC [Clostridia bacterium]